MTIYDFVKEQRDKYRSEEITVTDGYQFSQYETLRTIELYHNSRFLSGNKDSLGREKPFYNVCKFRVNVAVRATDLDTKDVSIQSDRTTKESYAESFLLNLKNRNWMRQAAFAPFLNRLGQTRAKFGGVLVKRTETDGELKIHVVPWLDLRSMDRNEALYSMTSPVTGVILQKWPKGSLRQGWGENPALYSSAANMHDAFHTAFGGHVGIDIASAHRTPIVAAHDAVVTLCLGERTRQGGLGVWIESDPYDGEEPGNSKHATVYSHLDEWIVQPGQRVTKGQRIGYMGNTGFVISGGTKYWGNAPAGKGVHLHFGLYEYKKNQDGSWSSRAVNVLRNTSDPLHYITETPTQPHGDLTYLGAMANRMLQYLKTNSA